MEDDHSPLHMTHWRLHVLLIDSSSWLGQSGSGAVTGMSVNQRENARSGRPLSTCHSQISHPRERSSASMARRKVWASSPCQMSRRERSVTLPSTWVTFMQQARTAPR
jgi:hypothetical protein